MTEIDKSILVSLKSYGKLYTIIKTKETLQTYILSYGEEKGEYFLIQIVELWDIVQDSFQKFTTHFGPTNDENSPEYKTIVGFIQSFRRLWSTTIFDAKMRAVIEDISIHKYIKAD